MIGWDNTQDHAEVWPIKGGLPGTTGVEGAGGSRLLSQQPRLMMSYSFFFYFLILKTCKVSQVMQLSISM